MIYKAPTSIIRARTTVVWGLASWGFTVNRWP